MLAALGTAQQFGDIARNGLVVGQCRALGDGDFEISDYPAAVARRRDFQRAVSRLERGSLRFEFRGKEPLSGKLVFDFLEGAQDRLAIVADGRIIARACGGELGAITASREEGQLQRGADRPNAAGPVEERAGVQGLETG